MAQTEGLLESSEQYTQQMRERNRWMIRFRWLYIILLPSIATIATLVLGHDKKYIKLYVMLLVAGLSLNGMLWLAARRTRGGKGYYRTLALAQILTDLCLASVVIYAQNGIASRATLLYAVPIMGAGALFRHPAAYIAAALSGVAYAGSVLGAAVTSSTSINMGDIWVPIIFYPSMFLLLASLITRFSIINSRDEQEKAYKDVLAKLRERLQQPAHAIAATVERLEAGAGYKDWTIEDKEYLSQIVRENARLNAMITNILESASQPQANSSTGTQVIDLSVLLQDASTDAALAIGRKSDLQVVIPEVNVPMYGQIAQVRKAFDNIIDNAFRYSPKGTPVTVSLTYNPVPGHITVTVADKGNGMSDEDQKHLFQLFSRLDEQAVAEGPKAEDLYTLGLGLYVSKVILERHHGKLEITSKKAEGTTVTVKIQEELWRRSEASSHI